jgi:hypothetical protein
MLVAIALSGVVGAVTTTVIVNSFRQQAATDARTAAVADVRAALQRTMRELRQADLSSLNAYSAKLSDGSQTLNYYLQTSNGVTSLVVDNGATKSVVVSNLVNDASQPVFSALRAPLAPTPAAGVDPATCAISGLSPTTYSTRNCVGTVTVRLRVMPMDASGKALCSSGAGCVIDVQDTADLRNVT